MLPLALQASCPFSGLPRVPCTWRVAARRLSRQTAGLVWSQAIGADFYFYFYIREMEVDVFLKVLQKVPGAQRASTHHPEHSKRLMGAVPFQRPVKCS